MIIKAINISVDRSCHLVTKSERLLVTLSDFISFDYSINHILMPEGLISVLSRLSPKSMFRTTRTLIECFILLDKMDQGELKTAEYN